MLDVKKTFRSRKTDTSLALFLLSIASMFGALLVFEISATEIAILFPLVLFFNAALFYFSGNSGLAILLATVAVFCSISAFGIVISESENVFETIHQPQLTDMQVLNEMKCAPVTNISVPDGTIICTP